MQEFGSEISMQTVRLGVGDHEVPRGGQVKVFGQPLPLSGTEASARGSTPGPLVEQVGLLTRQVGFSRKAP